MNHRVRAFVECVGESTLVYHAWRLTGDPEHILHATRSDPIPSLEWPVFAQLSSNMFVVLCFLVAMDRC